MIELLTEAERKSKAITGPDSMEGTDEETRSIMEGDEIRAPFKLEIMFGPKRTVNGPNICLLQAMESGKRLNGGGDELVYWCKDLDSDAGCWGPIVGDNISMGLAFCKECGTVNAEKLTGQRIMNVTTRRLAEHVATIWRQLGMNADIYCKYDPKDIRVEIMEKKVGAAKAHELRGLFIYSLKNILRDTLVGASVEDRFEAFFKA